MCLREVFLFDQEIPAMRNFALKWKYLFKQVERCFQLSKYCRMAFACKSFCFLHIFGCNKRKICRKEKNRERKIKNVSTCRWYSNAEFFIGSIFCLLKVAFFVLLREDVKAFLYVRIPYLHFNEEFFLKYFQIF